MAAAYLNAPAIVVIQRCTKVPYQSLREARIAQKSHLSWQGRGLVDIGFGKFAAYRCGTCRKIHLGHAGNRYKPVQKMDTGD